jgi:hypothetical protein
VFIHKEKGVLREFSINPSRIENARRKHGFADYEETEADNLILGRVPNFMLLFQDIETF